MRALDLELRAAFAASMLGSETTVLALKNKEGRALALASNFVTVELDGPAKPGALLRCRVIAARGGVCLAKAL